MTTPTGSKPQSSRMEISVDKADLLRELALMQGVVERKSTIPILSSFLFEASANNLTITATDLDVSLRTPCPVRVKREGSCTIPARKLYDYVRLLGDGEVVIRVLENDWIHIRNGRSHTKMVGLARKNFPTLPVFPPDGAIRLPAGVLRSMIAKTIFAISNEESRYTLNGALLVLQPGRLTMVATDGHRLAHIVAAKSEVPVENETRVLIPKKALAEINSLLSGGDETIGFAKDETTLFFRLGSRLLTCRQLAGTFPNYDAVMPRDLKQSVTVSCADLSRAMQRVSQFSDERSRAIRLKIDKSQLSLSSSNVEVGESEETLDTEYSGEAATIGFNAGYLLDFTRAAGAQTLSFSFKGPEAAAEFRPCAEGDPEYEYRYVVMPMRT